MKRIVVVGLVVIFSLASRLSLAEDCSAGWERFNSKPYQGLLFPDLAANYWRYRFEVPVGSPLALRVSGKFAHARYMNYNVYDQATLDSTGSLPDRDITPDAGAVNPFVEGMPRNAPNRDYTIHLVADGIATKLVNPLRMPKPQAGAATQAIELWYRLYVSDAGTGELAGVDLPRIQAVDAATGKEVSCPEHKTSAIPVLTALQNRPPGPDNGTLRFYASRGMALYQNWDNQYLVGKLDFDVGKVAVVRVRPPGFFDSSDPAGTFHSGTDVRYWSLCVVGIFTQTSACLVDRDALVGPDGLVTLVIGPDSVAAAAKKRRMNFLPRGKLTSPYLLFRHLLTRPDFPGAITGVPLWPPPAGSLHQTPESLVASNFIGDHAPTGRHCDETDFLAAAESGADKVCGVKIGLH